ncbi:MAG TPA: hypothetical protein VMZ29_17175 [Candidatus Bathyarchaeia archaeon]|nr:hypothetical protein [Candidatus Bathyarchaeia archaeon]
MLDEILVIRESLPKPEFIQGEIDYPEMIKADFKKAITIIGLSLLTTIVVATSIFLLAFFF